MPFPSCEEVVGTGASKVLIHNACDPCLFIRAPISIPRPSVDTSPNLNVMAKILFDSGPTHKALRTGFNAKKGLLDPSTCTPCEISGFYGSTQTSNHWIKLRSDHEKKFPSSSSHNLKTCTMESLGCLGLNVTET